MRDADATLILTAAAGVAASGGTMLAQELESRSGKPFLLVNVSISDAVECSAAWLAVLTAHEGEAPFKLGIGGSRESEAPGIYRETMAFIRHLGPALS